MPVLKSPSCEAGLEAVLVAVAAGDADRVPGVLHARALHESIIDRFAQRHVVEVRRADVADRRESGHQRLLGVGDAEDRAERIKVAHGRVVAGRIAERAADDVRVRVDEAGQQRRVAELDRSRAGGNRDGALPSDGDDLVVGHDHDAVLDRRGAGAVDDARGVEDDGAGALGFLGGEECRDATDAAATNVRRVRMRGRGKRGALREPYSKGWRIQTGTTARAILRSELFTTQHCRYAARETLMSIAHREPTRAQASSRYPAFQTVRM